MERNELDFVQRLAFAMQAFGYKSNYEEGGEYPASVFCKIIGYEDLPVDFVGMFLPDEEANGGKIRYFQLYISLSNKLATDKQKAELIKLFNSFNTSQKVGVFGVLDGSYDVCYKQAIIITNTMELKEALNLCLDTLIAMSIRLGDTYDKIAEILDKE